MLVERETSEPIDAEQLQKKGMTAWPKASTSNVTNVRQRGRSPCSQLWV